MHFIAGQFMSSPTNEHMEAEVHVLRYLKSNPNKGLLMGLDISFKLKAFCDADWATCPAIKRFISGFFLSC